MLKNLRVRTKLIAVLAVPLAALIVMAAIGVLDRRAEASDARDGRYLAELTAARVELVHQLQLERTLGRRHCRERKRLRRRGDRRRSARRPTRRSPASSTSPGRPAACRRRSTTRSAGSWPTSTSSGASGSRSTTAT